MQLPREKHRGKNAFGNFIGRHAVALVIDDERGNVIGPDPEVANAKRGGVRRVDPASLLIKIDVDPIHRPKHNPEAVPVYGRNFSRSLVQCSEASGCVRDGRADVAPKAHLRVGKILLGAMAPFNPVQLIGFTHDFVPFFPTFFFVRGLRQCTQAARALGCSTPHRGQMVGLGTAAPAGSIVISPAANRSARARPPSRPAAAVVIDFFNLAIL